MLAVSNFNTDVMHTMWSQKCQKERTVSYAENTQQEMESILLTLLQGITVVFGKGVGINNNLLVQVPYAQLYQKAQ